MKKGIAFLLLAMVLVATVFPTSAFAASKESPTMTTVKKISLASVFTTSAQVGLPTVYYVSSKTFVKNLDKVHVKDWTTTWSKASSYVLVVGRSYTSTLTVGAEGTVSDSIKVSSSFTQSRTFTCSVATKFIANSSKFSKLAHYRDYKQYSALIKYYAGTNGIPMTYGTVLVSEPQSGSYNYVRYQ